MSALSLITAVWRFVAGDDPIVALGAALTIGITALIATAGIPAWWVMPLGAIGLLATSLRRATASRE